MTMEFQSVSFIYNKSSDQPVKALEDVSFQIEKNEFVGLIGHTGSGKSTLVQHMNGLNLPFSGDVLIDGQSTKDKNVHLRDLRAKVGLVFQYPEDQLFEETVYKDIAFGPKNIGLSGEELDKRVKESMEAVGLDFDEFKNRSPFELSGGQKRRVAIAGVLALKPSYLVLDEPTAGLDPRGRKLILETIHDLYENQEGLSVVLVTHSMEDIASYAQRLLVIDRGRLVMDGSPKEIFCQEKDLEEIGLSIPQVTKFMKALAKKGYNVDSCALTVEEALASIRQVIKK